MPDLLYKRDPPFLGLTRVVMSNEFNERLEMSITFCCEIWELNSLVTRQYDATVVNVLMVMGRGKSGQNDTLIGSTRGDKTVSVAMTPLFGDGLRWLSTLRRERPTTGAQETDDGDYKATFWLVTGFKCLKPRRKSYSWSSYLTVRPVSAA